MFYPPMISGGKGWKRDHKVICDTGKPKQKLLSGSKQDNINDILWLQGFFIFFKRI